MFSRTAVVCQLLHQFHQPSRSFSMKNLKTSFNSETVTNIFKNNWRSLASITQPVKRKFLARWRRRFRNALIVTFVVGGSVYGYKLYRSRQWYNEMRDSELTIGQKPRVVVLGTGWGAVPLLKHIDTSKYEVVCVSPRNYFLMTPLLPSVSVGTVETRTVIEPIRTLVGPRIKYIETECINVNPKEKIITCSADGTKEITVAASDRDKLPLEQNIEDNKEGGSSSRKIRDSARTRPKFDMKYDYLVVAIGSENNTFGIPGVEKHAHFLKEVLDARRIRSAISDAFESAMVPSQTDEEKKRLLHFVVVGGGPTGVEFAAELADYVREDLKRYFPRLVENDVKITLIEALDHVLSMMDKKISDYTEKHFHRENIEVLINTFVKGIKQREVIVQEKGSTELKSIPCAVVVWATGIKARPLTNKLRETIGTDKQNNRMGLLTDKYLRVKGVDDGTIYALGDCATIEQQKLLDRIQLLFEESDIHKRGALTLDEFRSLIENKINEYPQLEIFQKGIEKSFYEADKTKSGQITLEALRSVLEKADKKLRSLPATAQVATQEGRYVADLLNYMAHPTTTTTSERFKPFNYTHLGSLAYVGGDAAVIDFSGSKPLLDIFSLKPLSGRGSYYLWKSFYFTEQFTTRTKVLLAFDWLRSNIFGRDLSRY